MSCDSGFLQYLGASLGRIFYGFTAAQGFDELGTYFAKSLNVFTLVKNSLAAAQAMLGDGFLVGPARTSRTISGTDIMRFKQVWRCYIIYNRTFWVIIPGIVILLQDLGMDPLFDPQIATLSRNILLKFSDIFHSHGPQFYDSPISFDRGISSSQHYPPCRLHWCGLYALFERGNI